MNRLRLLVIGRSGQVARALSGLAGEQLEILAVGRPQCDVTREDGAASVLGAWVPDVVVNAAAYTAVDLAQQEPEQAFAVNAEGAGRLAQACAALGAPLVHLSSDYVFDGRKNGPYAEADAPNPLGVYGASKLAGERAVQASGARHAILRTSWVYDAAGRNFVRTVLRLAAAGRPLRVVADQHGCPTYAPDLAEAVVAAALALHRGAFDSGVLHAAGSGTASWHDLACAAVEESARLGGPGCAVEVEAITSADYPTPAPRPRNSVLDCSRLEAQLGVRLPPWRESLHACVAALAERGFALD